MAKGICEFDAPSREFGEIWFKPESGPKNELLPPPGGMVEVGDGRTSLSLEEASFRSAFQIPVPQAKDDELFERPMTEEVEWEPQGPPPASADGVLGCDPVGDMELLANDPLRGRLFNG